MADLASQTEITFFFDMLRFQLLLNFLKYLEILISLSEL